MRPAFTEKPLSDLPLITVITVVFNGAKHLEATIRSIISLKYPKLEYLVIDGGSTDGTLEIIKKYQHNIDRYISETDNGIYDAMNKGIAMANGDWINFMNCGDRFAAADALNVFHDSADDVDIIYGDAIIVYPTFKTLLKKIPLNQSWKRMPFCHQACFTRSALMKKYLFDLQYKLSSDFNFIYRAYLNGKKFQYVNMVASEFDFTEGASIKNVFRSVEERKQIVLKNSFSTGKWIYHTLTNTYIYFAYSIKLIIGKKMTNLVTKILRKT